MKMNFKYLTLFAAACAVGFSSCSSDDENYPQNNGRFDTSFTLALSSPKTYSESAEDMNATTYELGFEVVDIFVFTGDGTLESHAKRLATDFEQIDGTSKWELKSTKRIAAMTGDKSIYVGLNLPNDIAANIKQNGPQSANSIVSISDLKRAEGISMFSHEVVKKTLIEEEGTSAKNIVTVPVSRLLAKVLFYETEADREYIVKDANGKATEAHFTVGNVNNEFFPLPDLVNFKDPNFTNEDMTTVFLQPVASPDPYRKVNLTGKDIALSNCVYTTENTVTDGMVIQGALTYGIVRVKYTPNEVLLDATGVSKGAPVAETFHLVRSESKGDMLFGNLADAEAYVAANPGDLETGDGVRTYTNGLMYYPVFLKDVTKAGASKYSVYRNTAYRVTIKDIYGLGSHTDDPNGLPIGIIDPTDPVEKETAISVDIVINDWVLAGPQDEDLVGR